MASRILEGIPDDETFDYSFERADQHGAGLRAERERAPYPLYPPLFDESGGRERERRGERERGNESFRFPETRREKDYSQRESREMISRLDTLMTSIAPAFPREEEDQEEEEEVQEEVLAVREEEKEFPEKFEQFTKSDRSSRDLLSELKSFEEIAKKHSQKRKDILLKEEADTWNLLYMMHKFCFKIYSRVVDTEGEGVCGDIELKEEWKMIFLVRWWLENIWSSKDADDRHSVLHLREEERGMRRGGGEREEREVMMREKRERRMRGGLRGRGLRGFSMMRGGREEEEADISFDPDWVGREWAQVEDEDKMNEERMLRDVWNYFRCGNIGTGVELCSLKDQFWRSASFSASLVVVEADGKGVGFGRKDLFYQRVVSRRGWKQTCFRLSQQKNENISQYESAVYGFLGNHPTASIQACKTWHDQLWFKTTQRCDEFLDYLLDKKLRTFRALSSKKYRNQPFLQRERSGPPLPVSIESLLESLWKDYPLETLSPFHLFQYLIMQGNIDAMVKKILAWTTENRWDGDRKCPISVLRFSAHFILLLKSRQQNCLSEIGKGDPRPSEDWDKILCAYIESLIVRSQYELVAFYVSCLSRKNQVIIYSEFLQTIPEGEMEIRRRAVTFAEEAGLNVDQIVVNVVEKTSREIQSVRGRPEPNRREIRKISALNWFSYLESHRVYALERTNALLREFFLAKRLNLVERVLETDLTKRILQKIGSGDEWKELCIELETAIEAGDPEKEREVKEKMGTTKKDILEFGFLNFLWKALSAYEGWKEEAKKEPLAMGNLPENPTESQKYDYEKGKKKIEEWRDLLFGKVNDAAMKISETLDNCGVIHDIVFDVSDEMTEGDGRDSPPSGGDVLISDVGEKEREKEEEEEKGEEEEEEEGEERKRKRSEDDEMEKMLKEEREEKKVLRLQQRERNLIRRKELLEIREIYVSELTFLLHSLYSQSDRDDLALGILNFVRERNLLEFFSTKDLELLLIKMEESGLRLLEKGFPPSSIPPPH